MKLIITLFLLTAPFLNFYSQYDSTEKAVVIFYKGNNMDPVMPTLLDGDKYVKTLSNDCKYHLAYVNSGKHTFWSELRVKNELPVNLSPGKTYYIECKLKVGFFYPKVILELKPNLASIKRRHKKKILEIIKNNNLQI